MDGHYLNYRLDPSHGILGITVLDTLNGIEEPLGHRSNTAVAHGNDVLTVLEFAHRRYNRCRSGTEYFRQFARILGRHDFIDADFSFRNLHPPVLCEFNDRRPGDTRQDAAA